MGIIKPAALLQYDRWNSNEFYWKGGRAVLFKDELLPIELFQNHPKDNSISSDDTVYFGKNSIVPRYKLDEYAKSKNITINKTNRVEYANTFVVNLRTLLKIYEDHDFKEYYYVPKDKPRSFSIRDVNKINSTYPIIFDKEYVKHYNLPGWEEFEIRKGKEFYLNNKSGNIQGDKQRDADTYNLINNYYTKHNKLPKLVFDETLMADLTKSLGNVIDHSSYENLRNMFESNSRDNWNLATEIMCNSDWERSKLYILFLMNEFYSRFNNTNNINYNALYSYFTPLRESIQPEGMNFYSFVNNLIRHGFDKEIITKWLIERVNKEFKQINRENNVVQIKDITL